MATGILTIADLRANKFRGALGDEGTRVKVNELLAADLANFNRELSEQMSFLAKQTTETSMSFGKAFTNPFVPNDEFGKPISRNKMLPSTVAFPVNTFTAGLGWSEKYFKMATGEEIMESYDSTKTGYAINQMGLLRLALFNNTNFNSWDEYNKVTLAVKRLYNSDSTPIPDYNGVSFNPASHTHYIARVSTLANSDVDATITHVLHHGYTNGVKVFINSANQADITALSKFEPLDSVRLVEGSGYTVQKLDNSAPANNRFIGLWDNQYDVWVKDSITPSGYVLVAATGEVEKPLGFRQLPMPSLQGLMFSGQIPGVALIAEKAEAIEDFGVWNRGTAAVLYIGNTTWANPS